MTKGILYDIMILPNKGGFIMKKILSFLLCVAMLLSMFAFLTACDKEETNDKNDDKKPTSSVSSVPAVSDEEMIIGSWKFDVGLIDAMGEETFSDQMGEMGEFFDLSKVKMVVTIEFKEDGKLSMSYDKADWNVTVDEVIDVMRDGMRDYMESLVSDMGMTMEEYEAALKAQGESLDSIIDEAVATAKDYYEEVDLDALSVSGKYEFKNGKLLVDGADTKYELKDGKLSMSITMKQGSSLQIVGEKK